MTKPIVLFLAANPKNASPLKLEQERNAITDELRGTPGHGEIEFRALGATTVHEVMRELNHIQPAFLHFSGHGSAEGIAFEDEDGQVQLVRPDALATMVRSTAPSIKAVLLNSCYSQTQAEVLREEIGCVIGMEGTIPDDAARNFAVGFYRAMGHRSSILNAFEQARATLSGLGHRGKPHLLTRADVNADALYLFEPAPAGAPMPAASPTATNVTYNQAGRDLIQNSLGTVQAGDHATITFSTGGERK